MLYKISLSNETEMLYICLAEIKLYLCKVTSLKTQFNKKDFIFILYYAYKFVNMPSYMIVVLHNIKGIFIRDLSFSLKTNRVKGRFNDLNIV